MPITVPAAFAEGLISAEGERARAWLAGLPALAERYLTRWRLTVDGPPMHGMAGLVLPVRAPGGDAVLKVSWPHAESEHEGLALRLWQGHGVVGLLAADEADSVLLLEKLDHTRPLTGAPITEAVTVCAGFLRSLAVPAPPQVRTMRALARRWCDKLPVEARDAPPAILAAAITACERFGPPAAATLTNEDLHYDNVLRGSDGRWRMIDPKPITGDPEFGVIPLLWNRFDASGLRARFAAVVRDGALDEDRARGWTLARAVDNWSWFAGHGEPAMADACRLIAQALL